VGVGGKGVNSENIVGLAVNGFLEGGGWGAAGIPEAQPGARCGGGFAGVVWGTVENLGPLAHARGSGSDIVESSGQMAENGSPNPRAVEPAESWRARPAGRGKLPAAARAVGGGRVWGVGIGRQYCGARTAGMVVWGLLGFKHRPEVGVTRTGFRKPGRGPIRGLWIRAPMSPESCVRWLPPRVWGTNQIGGNRNGPGCGYW